MSRRPFLSLLLLALAVALYAASWYAATQDLLNWRAVLVGYGSALALAAAGVACGRKHEGVER